MVCAQAKTWFIVVWSYFENSVLKSSTAVFPNYTLLLGRKRFIHSKGLWNTICIFWVSPSRSLLRPRTIHQLLLAAWTGLRCGSSSVPNGSAKKASIGCLQVAAMSGGSRSIARGRSGHSDKKHKLRSWANANSECISRVRKRISAARLRPARRGAS